MGALYTAIRACDNEWTRAGRVEKNGRFKDTRTEPCKSPSDRQRGNGVTDTDAERTPRLLATTPLRLLLRAGELLDVDATLR